MCPETKGGRPPAEGEKAGAAFASEVEAALGNLFEEPVSNQPVGSFPYDVVSDMGPTPGKDPKARFELGLAYREMGMLDDAIGKFEEAFRLFLEKQDLKQATRCCRMLTGVYQEVREYRKVVAWAEQGLTLSGGEDVEWKALEYERALALEILGEVTESLWGYRRIVKQDPDFRDVQARINRLEPLAN
jgi:lipopolysaccharide biosynthesis regulator YciM